MKTPEHAAVAVVQDYRDFFTATEMLTLSAFGEMGTSTFFFRIHILRPLSGNSFRRYFVWPRKDWA